MFGISIAEFLIIILVAILIIPARHWGDVVKFLARAVKMIRDFIWKITDATENIRDQIDRELPVDKIIKQTTNDVMDAFSVKRPVRRIRKK